MAEALADVEFDQVGTPVLGILMCHMLQLFKAGKFGLKLVGGETG